MSGHTSQGNVGRAAALFEPMSPAAFAPFDGMPGCCALARDTDFGLVWCNGAYLQERDAASPEELLGQTIRDVLPADQAGEREALMRPALYLGQTVAYLQMWKGVRRLTRVWPLDPAAFGHEGYFIIIKTLTDPLPEAAGKGGVMHFVSTGDLGALAVLSPRELEVFYYLAAGMTVNDTAEALFRSEKTIGRHVENIHKKMGYSNRAELVRDAVQRGLVHFTGRQWAELTDPKRALRRDVEKAKTEAEGEASGEAGALR